MTKPLKEIEELEIIAAYDWINEPTKVAKKALSIINQLQEENKQLKAKLESYEK